MNNPNHAHNKEDKLGVHALAFSVIFSVYALLAPVFSQATTLTFDPPTGSFAPGDTFMVNVRLDPDADECINATTVEVEYPTDLLHASVVAKGESVLTLWPGEPSIDHDKGIVTFSGGIPAGYCGRIQGDPGKTNVLAQIGFVMNAKSEEKISDRKVVRFSQGTQVLLNDGLGTQAPLITKEAVYVRKSASGTSTNEWLSIVGEDGIPPEVFTVLRTSDTNVFQGKHFIVFSTVDKQTGVHHFEVSEDDPVRFGMSYGEKTERAPWVTAVSPYELRDQSLRSRIIVRAYDHAGNIQETILPPLYDERTMPTSVIGGSSWVGYAIAIVVVLLVIFFAFMLYRKKQTPPQGG